MKKVSICSIGSVDFEKEVLKEKMPVLVLFMNRDSDFYRQIEVIKRCTAETHSDRLKVCLLEEESLEVCMEEYGVTGTPTFSIFKGGKEVNRLLGQAPPKVFEEFLSQVLASDEGSEEERSVDFQLSEEQ